MIRKRHHRRRSRWARRRLWASHRGRVRARARWRKERAARLANPPSVDADTLRWRALDDARGALLRHGATYTAASVTHWELRRSRRGRVNQVDLLINGTLWRTGALRDAASAIRRGRWRTDPRRAKPLKPAGLSAWALAA